jgi:hypothetical protein
MKKLLALTALCVAFITSFTHAGNPFSSHNVQEWKGYVEQEFSPNSEIRRARFREVLENFRTSGNLNFLHTWCPAINSDPASRWYNKFLQAVPPFGCGIELINQEARLATPAELLVWFANMGDITLLATYLSNSLKDAVAAAKRIGLSTSITLNLGNIKKVIDIPQFIIDSLDSIKDMPTNLLKSGSELEEAFARLVERILQKEL